MNLLTQQNQDSDNMSSDLCINWDTKIISHSRQIDTISVNPVINVYSVAILEYNMAVIHHYGCHTPLNQIWSNIIYMYFILIQIRQYSQT